MASTLLRRFGPLLLSGSVALGITTTAKAEEPQGDPVTLDNLFATVLHVLFDVPSLSLQTDVPRDIASLFGRIRPILCRNECVAR